MRREKALLPGPDIIAPTLYQMLLLLACKQMQHQQKNNTRRRRIPRPRACDCFSHLQVIQKSNLT
jgi:hypothetical protein